MAPLPAATLQPRSMPQGAKDLPSSALPAAMGFWRICFFLAIMKYRPSNALVSDVLLDTRIGRFDPGSVPRRGCQGVMYGGQIHPLRSLGHDRQKTLPPGCCATDSKNVGPRCRLPCKMVFASCTVAGCNCMHKQIAAPKRAAAGATVHGGSDQFVDLATLSPKVRSKGAASCRHGGQRDADLVVAQNPSDAPRRPGTAGARWHPLLQRTACSGNAAGSRHFTRPIAELQRHARSCCAPPRLVRQVATLAKRGQFSGDFPKTVAAWG